MRLHWTTHVLMDETEMPENIDYLSLDLDGDATIKALRKLD